MPESQQPEAGVDRMIGGIVATAAQAGHRRILDVGAGPGKWARLLQGFGLTIDALEIWQPYVERYSLPDLYNRVIVLDARDFREWDDYSVVIMGDVLEHMPKPDATMLVSRILASDVFGIFLSIPTTDCPQAGEPFGNPYEAHVAQWTHEELTEAGWIELHRGPVPSGLATVGTYCRFP